MPRGKATGKASGKTPGSVLKEKFIDKLGLSVNSVAKAIGENPATVNNIIAGKKFSVELALKLGKHFPEIPAKEWIELETSSRLSSLKADANFQAELKAIPKAQAKAVAKPAAAVKGARGAKADKPAAGKRGPKAGVKKAAKAVTGAKRGPKPKAVPSPESTIF